MPNPVNCMAYSVGRGSGGEEQRSCNLMHDVIRNAAMG
ncbi:hypothetical protein DGo_PB0522 (plasmid) [Deinococcus gobiensis I-0]|uniref:Uncharacterized protein n=1 Tax=Deinococcus gobiensis (strain DSM 21396 / JCM 16679 / CGMCC 1.7299 / I-0) TaxID=745776 RepID=H8H2P4_DEIGI|nr:hypothetical protein DGo_PB0522 [Deinococcus gobiensis I-0]